MQEGRPNLGPTFATAVRMCRRREASYWDSFDKAMIIWYYHGNILGGLIQIRFRFRLRIRIRNRIRLVKFSQGSSLLTFYLRKILLLLPN
jgi:hypothetical protein